MFPGRFRRRKSDSLGPRPASVSSLRARVHTHVDAQHEAGHLTQAASAEQINRRTDNAARVTAREEMPVSQAENSSLARCAPPGGGFVLPAHLAGKTKPPSGGASIRPRPVRQNLCGSFTSFPVQEQEPSSPSRSPRRLRNRSSSSSSVYEVSVCEEGEEWPEGRVLPVRGYGARPRTGRHVSGFRSGCGRAARGAQCDVPGIPGYGRPYVFWENK